MIFSNKKGFSLIELITAAIIISIGIIGILTAINKGMYFANKTRNEVIAINLAREGIEGVFNIRDTNWVKWSGKKDQCRLKQNPLVDTDNNGCEDDAWIGSGNYVLSGSTFQGNGLSQQYFSLSGINKKLDQTNGPDFEYIMCQQSGYWYNCPNSDNYYGDEGKYFRAIEGKGLFNKKNGNLLNCSEGSIDGNDMYTTCPAVALGTAMEFRFCSNVIYLGKGKGNVKLCSVITNFLE